MLREIIVKELIETFSSIRFIVIFTACTVLILLSVFTGIRNYQENLRQYEAAVSVVRDTAENQVSYEALGVWGQFKLYRRPSALSAWVEGLEGELGRNTTMSIYEEPQLDDTKFNEQPIYAIFGTLDLAFIVKVVLSLFAIVFTFDAICGERERGTLKLLLANAIPRDTVILGKLIGSFLGLVLPLMIPLLLGVLILSLVPEIELNTEAWLRIALILGLSLSYITVFLALGLLVSTRTSRSAISFLVLLVAWVLFVLVIPKASVMLAAQAAPVPSGAEIEARRQAIGRDWYREWFAETERWLREHPERRALPRSEQIPSEVAEQINRRLAEQADLKRRRISEEYTSAQRRRMGLAIWVSRLSPTAAYSHAIMSLAHTGIDRQERFLEAAKTYRQQFQEYIQAKLREERRLRAEGFIRPAGANKLDIADMPQFHFQEESLNESIERTGIDMALLFLFAVVFFAAAFVSFLRYDVR